MFSKCFVTGGSGFLGRTLLERLQEHCQEIYALVQEGDPLNSYIPKGIHVMKGDLREEESVEAFFGFCGFRLPGLSLCRDYFRSN